jgi:CelD/BcsL family acetyltransferase involved in cellulose biosynthesis
MPRVEIVITQRRGLDGVAAQWRALESRVPELSFFQSWTWMGCLAEERFPDPVLLQAEQAGQVVGLALFNRRGGRLSLAESGDAVLDAPFTEHNGPLVTSLPGLDDAMLRAAWRIPGARRLVLGGVPPPVLRAALEPAGGGAGAPAGGVLLRCQQRVAPYVDLGAIRDAGGDHLATLSANTRQQIRRSHRRYAAAGPLRLLRAGDAAEALAMLDALIQLHERSWQARGRPGAFAHPFLRRFHAALVARAMARDELDLLRLEAGPATVGLLYNFRLRGRISAYQSGLDLAAAGPHGKPGLSSHALAVQRAADQGDAVYDFLGGADRYKRSLANAAAPLVWAELAPRWSLAGLARRLVPLRQAREAGPGAEAAHPPAFRSSSRGNSLPDAGPGPGPD